MKELNLEKINTYIRQNGKWMVAVVMIVMIAMLNLQGDALAITYTNNRTGSFDRSNSAIKKCVLNEYLPIKVATYMGVPLKNVNDNTIVRVNQPYNNSEGELNNPCNVKGLRIDLQRPQTINNRIYATWQVQYGTGQGSNGGAYAGALMLTNTNFILAQFRQALEGSFNINSYCRMDPEPPNAVVNNCR
ncbi:hypothetical protein [Microcoleus sp. CAWBG58]|uniref:hypothetical protein n=1 Tax=Microcoleus sp. CAWBG58 TaxID=2841651 RepID=UPI0025DD9089|nr:hypothetical protein [Microcoleus sp. CAWBG58]